MYCPQPLVISNLTLNLSSGTSLLFPIPTLPPRDRKMEPANSTDASPFSYIVVLSKNNRSIALAEYISWAIGNRAHVICPTYKAKQRTGVNRKVRPVVRPVFGPYLFVGLRQISIELAQIMMSQSRDFWRILRVKDTVLRITDSEIGALSQYDWQLVSAPTPEGARERFPLSTPVRIVAGPLIGLNGTYVGNNRVEIMILGRRTKIIVPSNWLKENTFQI